MKNDSHQALDLKEEDLKYFTYNVQYKKVKAHIFQYSLKYTCVLTGHDLLADQVKSYVETNAKYQHAKMNQGFDYKTLSKYLVEHKRKKSMLMEKVSSLNYVEIFTNQQTQLDQQWKKGMLQKRKKLIAKLKTLRLKKVLDFNRFLYGNYLLKNKYAQLKRITRMTILTMRP
ncbi:UNKNOWN [Stylonychia lemnae]|uniref:Uncharacterized protein n=1 Tax=Stylonychia lemnae TaxID=5949 RepID=A0A078AAL3_STYLE|nr:UNKNOWN [Stylonychia lemnae]|eukprot:CDW78876.1 UNKNOWN [Stylonychia lemnae]